MFWINFVIKKKNQDEFWNEEKEGYLNLIYKFKKSIQQMHHKLEEEKKSGALR